MVPNLPSPLVIPTAGTPPSLDAEGAGVDFFARLLGGGPSIAAVAGPSGQPVDEITLRAAPADGEANGLNESAPDEIVTPDIIPLLQAQSGFPVAIAPVASVPIATPLTTPPDQAVPVDVPAEAVSQPTTRIVGTPVAKASPVAHAARATAQAAQAARIVAGEGDVPPAVKDLDPLVKAAIQASKEAEDADPADVVAAAVKPVIDKLRGQPDRGGGKVVHQGTVVAEDAPAQPVVAQSPQRQPEAALARPEPVVQSAAPIPAMPVSPAFANAPAPQQPASAVTPAPTSVPDVAELVVERQLDLANDNLWLDRLARDIARAGASDEPLRFRLHPQTLGHLQVELAQSDRGTTVRLTVETEAARNILVDAQPRLAAEARAQGVRLAGTEVDLGTAGQQGDARRQADAQPQNIVRVVRSTQTSTPSPGQAESRSDRYA